MIDVGPRARLPLSSFGTIHPPLPARILKGDWVDPVLGFDQVPLHTPFERVLQTYAVPLAAFQTADPAFRPGKVSVVRLEFVGPDGGWLFLDDVGFFDH